jgi:hypothetical protein
MANQAYTATYWEAEPPPDVAAWFTWTYECSCGHRGDWYSNELYAHRGWNGHMNAHRVLVRSS